MAAHRAAFTAPDVYQLSRKGSLDLGNLGALRTASREMLRAKLTGTPVDKAKVGSVGDVIIGAGNIAAYLNSLCSSAEVTVERLGQG